MKNIPSCYKENYGTKKDGKTKVNIKYEKAYFLFEYNNFTKISRWKN
jgi:hypothetical protein